MAQLTGLRPILTGQLLDADTHRNNFLDIKSVYNSHDRNNSFVHGVPSNEEIGTTAYYTDLLNSSKPVGTVIEVWDNDLPEVSATIDADKWVLLDGATISDVDSMFNGETIPDATNAYFMCSTGTTTGTEGNINNIKNIEHNHSMTHSHPFSHTHETSSHSHDEGTEAVAALSYAYRGGVYVFTMLPLSGSVTTWSTDEKGDCDEGVYLNVSSSSPGSTPCADVYFSTNTTTHTVVGSTTHQLLPLFSETSSSDLSSTQDIRPYSIKVRYYLRYK